MIWDGADIIITDIKCTVNVTCLNHPGTIPPTLVHGKLSSMKLLHSARKVGGHCLQTVSWWSKASFPWLQKEVIQRREHQMLAQPKRTPQNKKISIIALGHEFLWGVIIKTRTRKSYFGKYLIYLKILLILKSLSNYSNINSGYVRLRKRMVTLYRKDVFRSTQSLWTTFYKDQHGIWRPAWRFLSYLLEILATR